MRQRTNARTPAGQSISGLGGAKAGIAGSRAGQAPLRRSRLRISYSCTIA